MDNACSCLITHIEIVGKLIKVWVQHSSKMAQEIEDGISSIKNQLEYAEGPSVEHLTRSQIFLSKYTDNEYYRCAVLGRSTSSPSKVNVAFIDYGNTLAVNVGDLRIMSPETKAQVPILSCPGQATFYYLYAVAVIPGAMNEPSLDWLKALTVNIEYQCYVYDGLYGIRMISIFIEHNLELSNLLVQKGIGQMISRDDLCTMARDMMQYSASVSSGSSQLSRFPSQPPQAPKVEVIPSASRKPTMPLYQPPPVYQHMISQQQVNSVQQQRFIVPKEKLVSVIPFPTQSAVKKNFDNTITVGSAYQMYVSHVEDGPLQFSLQLRQYADEVLPYLTGQFNKLVLQKFTSALTIGMMVVGMHPPDKTLRRAMITSAASNTCRVYYVDIGASETLSFANIFQLPTNMNVTQIPAVAINFSLKGMDSNQVTEVMKSGFRDLVMSKVVLAKVITEGPTRTCDLFVDGRDVKTLLASLNQPLQYLRQFPPREKDTKVAVSYVDSPQQIFVQYKSEASTLATIEEAMATFWFQQREITNVNDLSIGKPILSLYSSDNHWYRAQVMEVSSNQSVTVLYVDYGNKEFVSASTLREISADLVSKWRCQAVECCLVGFDAILPSDILAEKLEEKILGCDMTLRVHSLLTAEKLLVDLIDATGNSVAAYITEVHNTCMAEAQASSYEAPAVVSREPVQTQPAVEIKPDKEFDINERIVRTNKKKDDNQKFSKGKDSSDDTSNKWKSKDDNNKWKSKDPGDDHAFGKNRKKDYDDYLSKRKDYDDYPSKKKDYDDYSSKKKDYDDYPSKKKDYDDYSSRKKDHEDYSSKKKDYDDYSSRKKDHDDYSSKKKDYDDFSSKKKDYDDYSSKKKDYDDYSGRKKNYDDYSGRKKDYDDYSSKKKDYDDYSSKRKDHDDYSGKKKDYDDYSSKKKDYGDSNNWRNDHGDSSTKWKSSHDDRMGGGDADLAYKRDKQNDSKFRGKDDGKWRGRDREDSRGSDRKWNKEERFQVDGARKDGKKDFSGASGSRKWDDDGKKGRGEFKWKESNDYDSKRIPKTLYSDAPTKDVKSSESWDNEHATTPSDIKFNPKVKEFVGWNLEGKTAHTVTLAHIDSPERFFLRPIEADPELDRIRDMIDSDTNAKSRVLLPKSVLVGTPVLAVYSEDSQLYRAVIEKINNKTVEVLFVDFGNSAEIPCSELYYPLDNLARLPMTVVRCCISNVKPTSGTGWTADTDALIECFGGESQLVMTLESVKLVDGLPVHNVSLTIVDTGKDVTQALVDAGLAKSTLNRGGSVSLQTQESVEPISTIPLQLAEEPTTEEVWVERVELLVGQFLMSMVMSIISTETIVVKLDATNLLLVCVSHDTSSVQVGDKVIIHVNCILDDRLRVTIYDKGGYVAGDTKKELPQISPVCKMPITRSRFRVIIPHCEKSLVYIQRVQDIDRITEMLDTLFTMYEDSKVSSKEFVVNSLCAAKSSDGNWYRARVVKKDGDLYTVSFIDYGNKEEMDSSCIRKLDGQFYFPEYAFKAEVNLKWVTQIEDLDLMKFLEGKEFTATLLKNNVDDWHISLEDDDNKTIASKVVDSGLAEQFRENPFLEVNSVIGNDIVTGDKIPITVTHVESPGSFWVQMIKHLQTVESIQDRLQNFTDAKRDTSCAVFAAKYSADEQWYRALNIDSNNPDLVRFIDYGNTDVVTERKDLSFSLTKPRSGYAVKMYLCAVPKDGNWSEQALELFEQLIDADQVIAEIVSVSYKIVTDLTVNGKSVCKILIDKGFAIYEDFTPIIIKNYLSIKESQTTNVFICHSTSVNDFYALDKNRVPELEEFTMNLSEMDSFKPLRSYKVGDLVVAKFPDDDSWYRAKIISTDPLEVIFTDFGNSSQVDEIGEIPSEMKDVQPFAIHCSLGFENDSDLALDKFIELSDEGKSIFCMTLISKGDPNIVKLTLNDTNVCELLPKIQSNLVNIDGKVAFVSHFNHFDDFYVQLQEDSKLDNVVDELAEAESFSDVEKTLSVGSIVAAQFPEDELWYRAKVTSTEPLSVMFYDYGNSSEVINVKELPPDLKLIPALSYKCSLQKPSNVSSWTEDMIDSFLNLSQDGQNAFTIELVKSGNPNIIHLLTESNQNVVSLISTKVKSSNSVHKGEVANLTCGITTMSVKAASPSGKEKPSTTSIHNKLVNVANFESVDDFYVTLVDELWYQEKIDERLSNVSKLEEYSKPVIDDIVVAPYPLTGEWKRGKIISLDPVKVFFVDDGLISDVCQLKKIPDDLKLNVVKQLAIHCSLKKPENTSEWQCDVESLSSYMEVCTDILKAKVHVKGEPCVISLFDNDNKNILQKLGDSFGEVETSSVANTIFQTPSLYNNKVVYISHSNSICSFYVQKEMDSAKLEEVRETLSSANTFEPVVSVEIGALLAAKFPEDDMWYRGIVIKNDPDVVVKFIDYGNSSTVTELKELPQHLNELPPLALHCCLDLPKGVKSWTTEMEEKFNEISSDSETPFVFRAVSPGNPCAVTLLRENGDILKAIVGDFVSPQKDKSEIIVNAKNPKDVKIDMNNKFAIISHINDLDDFYVQILDDAEKMSELIVKLTQSENFAEVKDVKAGSIVAAQFTDMQWHRAKILKKDKDDIEVCFIDYGNVANITNIKELPQELVDMPVFAHKLKLKKPEGIPDWTEAAQKQFHLFKELNSQPLLILTYPSGCVSLMLNEISIYNKFTTLPLDRKDDNFVFVTYCESPANFYVQYHKTFESQQKVIEAVKDVDGFKKAENVKEGDIVLAKYPDDESWYRSKILKTSPELSVIFIDFGSCSDVTEIKELPEDLKSIEPLAKHCCLAPPRGGVNWTAEACSYFLAMSSSPFNINVIEEGSPSIVDLFIDGNSVTSDLLELCPVVDRLPQSDNDDIDLDEEDIMREEALFMEEESMHRAAMHGNNPGNDCEKLCNGISDISLDEPEKLSSVKEESKEAESEIEGNLAGVTGASTVNPDCTESTETNRLESEEFFETRENVDEETLEDNDKPEAELDESISSEVIQETRILETESTISENINTSEVKIDSDCDDVKEMPHNESVKSEEPENTDLESGVDPEINDKELQPTVIDSTEPSVTTQVEPSIEIKEDEISLPTNIESKDTESSNVSDTQINSQKNDDTNKEDTSDSLSEKIPFDEKLVSGVVSRGEIIPEPSLPKTSADEKILAGAVQGNVSEGD